MLKNMTLGSYSPQQVLKVPFHSSPSQMQILLYPYQISNLLNSSIPWRSSMHCARLGSGVMSFLVTALSGW